MSKWNRSIGSNTYDGVGLLVNMVGSAYRPPTYKWTVPYEEWRDDASCNGLPVQLFELNEELDADEQHELIAEGLKVCSGCPVRAACKTNSSELDRYWTTRGGQPPEGLFPDTIMPKFKGAPIPRGFAPGKGPVRGLQVKCKRGHEDWRIRKDGKRYCYSCKQAGERKRWSTTSV